MIERSQQLKTAGHILREISGHVHFFLKEENDQINGTVHSVNYRPYPITARGSEIPLIVTFKSPHYIIIIKMKEFVTSLCSFDFIAKETEPLSSDEEKEINPSRHLHVQR